GVADRLGASGLAQLVEDLPGRGHAHVRPDQCLLELIPGLLVDLAGADRAQVAAEGPPGLGQPVAEGGPRRSDRLLDDLRGPLQGGGAGPHLAGQGLLDLGGELLVDLDLALGWSFDRGGPSRRARGWLE